jgi:hypothetical protein
MLHALCPMAFCCLKARRAGPQAKRSMIGGAYAGDCPLEDLRNAKKDLLETKENDDLSSVFI